MYSVHVNAMLANILSHVSFMYESEYNVSDIMLPVHHGFVYIHFIVLVFQLEVEVQAQTISVAVPILIGTMPPLESNLTLWSHNGRFYLKVK